MIRPTLYRCEPCRYAYGVANPMADDYDETKTATSMMVRSSALELTPSCLIE